MNLYGVNDVQSSGIYVRIACTACTARTVRTVRTAIRAAVLANPTDKHCCS